MTTGEDLDRLADALLGLRDHGHMPMYNGRPSCPFCHNFVDDEETHRPGCILLAAPSLIADARDVERLRAVEQIARAIVAEADADTGMYGPEHHGIAHQFRAVLEPGVAE